MSKEVLKSLIFSAIIFNLIIVFKVKNYAISFLAILMVMGSIFSSISVLDTDNALIAITTFSGLCYQSILMISDKLNSPGILHSLCCILGSLVFMLLSEPITFLRVPILSQVASFLGAMIIVNGYDRDHFRCKASVRQVEEEMDEV